MNICLVSREYPPETGWGGIGTYTYNLAHGLNDLGHEIHVISYAIDNEADYLDKKIHIHRIKEKNIKGLWRIDKYFPILTILYSIRVSQKINELVKKHGIEIVEAPEWSAEVFWYSIRKRKPLVIKFHTPMFLIQELNALPKTIKGKIICFLERITSLRADILTAPSKALAKIIAEKYSLNIGTIKIVPNPIDENFFKPLENNASDESYVLYVGRLEWRKGVHILADSIPDIISKYPDLKFLFIGKDMKISRSNGSMKEYILKKVGNHKNISFVDHIDRDKLVEYYQKSSICIFPSLWEAYGYTGLEALACGKPTILTDTFGLCEFIKEDGVVIKIKPDNSYALTNKIIELIADVKLRKQMEVRSREIVKQFFSQKSIASKTLDIYHGLNNRDR